jgi:glycosyltransferase involved in cell wall biosynthesis
LVGRLEKQIKQPHIFLHIAESLPEKRFVLIGIPDMDKYTDEIQQRASQLHNVEYLESVDPDKIHEYYKNAIAIINTSKSEGFPNTFLEAWRYGTPVVSLDVDPNRFITTSESFHGNGNTSNIINACKLLSQGQYWESASKRVRSEFESEYGINQVGQDYYQAIAEMER